ncbi:MAG: zinc-ribbon domain-containing protein [Lachnospiraceae bacterium]|nr:zinc-ribbon domain-containing protein [Lachnospiraceae bacterium]
MKTCPNCHTEVDDSNVFCPVCGTNIDNPAQTALVSYKPDWDHTAEFDAKDISDNKVVAMLMYLTGLTGALLYFAILWLIGKSKSEYLAFHVKENFKLSLVETLVALISIILCWTIIIPIAGLICEIILLVVRVICFVQCAKNESKEAAIIRGFKFLK